MATAGTSANKKQGESLKDILGPMDPKIDAIVREKLITARVGLLLRASFFGNLATRLKLVNADEWLSTAATDGRHFYYNSRFINMLRPKEVEFLFGHEVLHCVYDHMGRAGSRDKQLFNVAADYCVNADLVKHRVGEKITTVGCLHDSKYDGMSAEQVYDLLQQNADKMSMQDLIDQLLDDHLDGDDDGDGEGDENDDGSKGPRRLTQAEKDAIRDEIKEAVLAAAAATDGIGNLPAGVRRMIEDMTDPKMNWRELLRMQLESTIKSDFTWMRTGRKGWDMDAVMPGMKLEPMIDIGIAIDASGSISGKMLKEFLSEVQGIMDSFPAYKIHIITWDTEAYNPQQYNSDNLDTICDYEVTGGGGTDVDCVFKYFRDNEIEPKRLVIFTDGYFHGFGDENYCDVVWIVHSNDSFNPTHGEWASYDEE